jgi:hypothetical protein
MSRSDLARAMFAAFDARDVSALAAFMTEGRSVALGNAEIVAGMSGFDDALTAFLGSVAGFRHEVINCGATEMR